MVRLQADFSPAFSRDLKKKAGRRGWNLDDLAGVIDLVLENSPESLAVLRRRHNMHSLAGNWQGSNECHVANVGDWLVIWASDGRTAYFERTGSHGSCSDRWSESHLSSSCMVMTKRKLYCMTAILPLMLPIAVECQQGKLFPSKMACICSSPVVLPREECSMPCTQLLPTMML